jgi:hypothetical protein
VASATRRLPHSKEQLHHAAHLTTRRDIRGYADTITKPEADAITWYLVIFIFVARLPFMIVENWAFLKFVEAIRPAYARFLPGRTSLSTTQLKKVYEDTIERTEQALNAVPGKKTFVIDGFKDRVGRHVMNFFDERRGVGGDYTFTNKAPLL